MGFYSQDFQSNSQLQHESPRRLDQLELSRISFIGVKFHVERVKLHSPLPVLCVIYSNVLQISLVVMFGSTVLGVV